MLNEFTYLNKLCENAFDYFEQETGKKYALDQLQKRRFGFYFYIINLVTGVTDIDEICQMIIDTDFMKTIYEKGNDDRGVDAVFINNDEKEILLFNFKFREKYVDKAQRDNDVRSSMKFINNIMNFDETSLQGATLSKIKKIIKLLEKPNQWSIKLYMVSNDLYRLTEKSTYDEFNKIYGVELISMPLEVIRIMNNFSKNKIDAILGVSKEDLMVYRESNTSSKTSYILSLPLSELLRITINDNELRNKICLENINELKNKRIDYSVLYDNVRGFLGSTNFNQYIFKTLNEEPTKFFMYNNGITMTVSRVSDEIYNTNKNIKLRLNNLQVVNGGQTLRILDEYLSVSSDLSPLERGKILVKIYDVGEYNLACENILGNKISEYTNSQNKIMPIDLKSLAQEQFEIEKILDSSDILYYRKRGSNGLDERKKYKYRISLEKFGQILFSIQGNPHKASNQKSKIFNEYYDDVFKSEKFIYEKCPEYVEKYYDIKKKLKKSLSEQYVFYILYISYKVDGEDYKKYYDIIEETVNEYIPKKKISDARKLITTEFKDIIDGKINDLLVKIG